MTVSITGVHPYAEKFPMLGEAELAELAESIAENGLRNPIVLTPDGLILDGRNRSAACERAGVSPTTIVYEGDDLAEYVIDCNSSRRHMSTGARAMATALVLSEDGRRGEGRWRRGTVNQISDLSDGYRVALNNAGIILDHSPDLAEQVIHGNLALDAAYRRACDARDAERIRMEAEQRLAAEEADAKAFVEERSPDLAARVDGSDLQSFVEARDLWQRRNREEAARLKREREERDRAERERVNALTHTYTDIAQAVQCLASFGAYDDPLAIMRDFETRFVNPPQLMKEFSRERLGAASRFALALIDYMEGRNR